MKVKILGLAVLALSAVAAMAQNAAVKVKVPFDFIAGGTTVSAGTYKMEANSSNWMVSLTQPDGRGVYLLSQPRSPKKIESLGALVFHRYGDRYFLREMRTAGGWMNYGWPESKQEKALRTSGSPRDIATVNFGQPTVAR